jgi:hypothetical protein
MLPKKLLAATAAGVRRATSPSGMTGCELHRASVATNSSANPTLPPSRPRIAGCAQGSSVDALMDTPSRSVLPAPTSVAEPRKSMLRARAQCGAGSGARPGAHRFSLDDALSRATASGSLILTLKKMIVMDMSRNGICGALQGWRGARCAPRRTWKRKAERLLRISGALHSLYPDIPAEVVVHEAAERSAEAGAEAEQTGERRQHSASPRTVEQTCS